MRPPFCVLTIAGSDSGGGAGVQSDQRTIQAIGGHALTAVTAVTAQDTRAVRSWRPVSPGLIGAQIESALAGFDVAAAKTGLLAGAAAVRAVARALSSRPRLPLVVDPVIASTSGTRFLDAAGLRALRSELLPRALLVTPNWDEARALAGMAVSSPSQAERAALSIARDCGKAVLVKGGHGRGGLCLDCLVLAGGSVLWFEHRRLATRNTHGTGCVLSAAIAAWIGRGAGLEHAVRLAQAFLQRSLQRGRDLDWGGGRGPALTTVGRRRVR